MKKKYIAPEIDVVTTCGKDGIMEGRPFHASVKGLDANGNEIFHQDITDGDIIDGGTDEDIGAKKNKWGWNTGFGDDEDSPF